MTHGNVAVAEPALTFKDRLASAGGIPLPGWRACSAR